MLLQASQEGQEGEDGDAELPPEQLLPGMQHLSVAYREALYTGGDECEGPQGKIQRQVQVSFPLLPVHSTCCSRVRLGDVMLHRMSTLVPGLMSREGHRGFSDHWDGPLASGTLDVGLRRATYPTRVVSSL